MPLRNYPYARAQGGSRTESVARKNGRRNVHPSLKRRDFTYGRSRAHWSETKAGAPDTSPLKNRAPSGAHIRPRPKKGRGTFISGAGPQTYGGDKILTRRRGIKEMNSGYLWRTYINLD